MSFLALIIAIVLERLTSLDERLPRDGWYRQWRGRLAALGLRGRVQAVLALLLPVLAAALVLAALRPLLFGLAWIAAAVAILLYSMGGSNLGAQQERYRSQCRRGDFEAAWRTVAADYDWFPAAAELDARTLHQRTQAGFLYEAYQRWFAVLFYFVLLGPVGALAYRLLHLESEGNTACQRLLGAADWVPVRLLAAAFTLTGNFVASADALWEALRASRKPAAELLYSIAGAATGENSAPANGDELDGQRAASQNEIFVALLRRSSICWVAFIAALVIVL